LSVYNGEKYIKQAIDSILNQTFNNFEFLIINDASIDKTLEILKSYKDNRIKILNNKENIGLTKSLNKGLRISKGEYIIRQDADDISSPDRIKKQLEFMENNPDHAVAGTFAKIVDDESKLVKFWDRPVTHEEIQKSLKIDNCIAHGSVIMRKKYLLDIGLYDERMEKSQDYDLWLRLAKKYKMANIPEYLYIWRKHHKNVGINYMGDKRIFFILAKIKNDVLNIDDSSKQFINYIINKDFILKHKPLYILYRFNNLITNNKLMIINFCKLLYRIRFTSRVKKILDDFKKNKISFEEAKFRLRSFLNEIIR
jgi:glycosyltransferase involved in cell wall biosynthesis